MLAFEIFRSLCDSFQSLYPHVHALDVPSIVLHSSPVCSVYITLLVSVRADESIVVLNQSVSCLHQFIKESLCGLAVFEVEVRCDIKTENELDSLLVGIQYVLCGLYRLPLLLDELGVVHIHVGVYLYVHLQGTLLPSRKVLLPVPSNVEESF